MIVSLYAALLALLFVFLAVRTIKARITHGTALGDGGHHALQRAIRAHAHFAEYVPFSLLLLLLLELQGASYYLLHGLGSALILGRLLHAYSLLKGESYENGQIVVSSMKFRQFGMFLSFGVIGISALALLFTF
ncbi:MAG: MAPEG family protein [Rickettsiales bacterium]